MGFSDARPATAAAVFVVLAFFAAVPVMDAAQIIPPGRTSPEAWQNAGYPGEIPSPAAILNVRDFGASGDGVANDYPAVAAAIAALGGNPGVVYFPAGTYLIRSQIQLPGGAVLRGERASNTTLRFDFVAHAIYVSAAQSGTFQTVVSGANLHAASLTVADGSAFAPGDYAEIRADNDATWSATDTKVAGQILRVAAVSGNVVTLERPLRLDYQALPNPEIRRITPVRNAGIENLKVERLLAGTATDRNNVLTIGFNYAVGCWVRGVEASNCFGGHVGIRYSSRIEVTGCYFHDAHEYDGGGSGYGVRLEYRPGECLVENNIFKRLRHAMLVQWGANGNVFGYNYSIEPNRTEYPAESSADIALHGNYPHANLFEGNIAQHILIDNSHGANGPLNTFFRNRAESYGFNMTDTRGHRQNIVGLETFKGDNFLAVLAFGDGYSLKAADHFLHANNTEPDGIEPDGSSSLADFSYYLNDDPMTAPAVPAFWSIPDALPTVGLPQSLNPAKAIPARSRYLAGGVFTVGPPSLAHQPTSQTVDAGEMANLVTQATGSPAARFQWRKNGIPVVGQTGPVLSIPASAPGHAGTYDCVISDDLGSVTTSSATLTVIDNFPAWLGRHGIVDPSGDTDFDGLAEISEYAMGSDPHDSAEAAALLPSVNAAHLTLTYTRVKNTPDVLCTAEASDTPGGVWSDDPGDVTQFWQVADHGVTQTITARDRVPASASRSRFMRLRFTLICSE